MAVELKRCERGAEQLLGESSFVRDGMSSSLFELTWRWTQRLDWLLRCNVDVQGSLQQQYGCAEDCGYVLFWSSGVRR